MKGMMTLKQFLILIGLTELTFLKGKGRAFVGTPVGTVYKALKFDEKGPKYITVHRGGKTPDGKDMSHLEGTLWLVNSSVQLDGTYTE